MSRPRISIVTPCLNQVETIERTIRSVLDQEGPRAEYLVIDGGSTDGTREVIERYRDRLACWTSGPDGGQSAALNLGFARATGEVRGWLNGDDVLRPGALQRVEQVFAGNKCDVLCGACRYVHPQGREIVRTVERDELARLAVYDPIHQPSCFWRRGLHERVGPLDERLEFGMDWDLWLRFQRAGGRFRLTDDVLSDYHVTGTNKTVTGGRRRNREMYEILQAHATGPGRVLASVGYRLLWPMKRWRGRQPAWLWRPASDVSRTACWLALGPIFGFARVRRCTHPFC